MLLHKSIQIHTHSYEYILKDVQYELHQTAESTSISEIHNPARKIHNPNPAPNLRRPGKSTIQIWPRTSAGTENPQSKSGPEPPPARKIYNPNPAPNLRGPGKSAIQIRPQTPAGPENPQSKSAGGAVGAVVVVATPESRLCPQRVPSCPSPLIRNYSKHPRSGS